MNCTSPPPFDNVHPFLRCLSLVLRTDEEVSHIAKNMGSSTTQENMTVEELFGGMFGWHLGNSECRAYKLCQ